MKKLLFLLFVLAGTSFAQMARFDGVVLPTGSPNGPATVAVCTAGGSTAFASLPACSASLEGAMEAVTDSSTAVWGATITGSSTNHVLAYCDGTNWTVAAK